MQVYVKSLQQNADSEIVAYYEDATSVPGDAHTSTPDGVVPVLLWGIDSKYIMPGLTGPATLLATWRDSFTAVVDAEAQRRIQAVFPSTVQSAAALLRQNDMLSYGVDVTAWPPDQQDKNTEIKRGTDYITAVNAAAAQVKASAPNNPCDDAFWPASIDPISF